jgi:hypothetical protein
MNRACQRQILGLPLPVLPLDRHGAEPVGAQQHNPRPPHVLLRTVPRSDHGFQPFAVARTKPDFYAFPHPHKLAHLRARGNPSLVSTH